MATLAAALSLCGLAAGGAPPQTRPAEDLASLREAVKTLKWREVDLAQTGPLERCRALLFLTHALDEIGAADATQADLLSEYLEQQQLGTEFAASTLPAPVVRLTFDDGLKIAVALLRGPLAQSSWAAEMAGSPEKVVQATVHLYEATCQRKWAEVAEARQQVGRMSKFLKAAGKLQDFDAWLPGAVERRQREHDAEMARRRAAYVAEGKAEEQRAAEIRKARQQQENEAAAQQMEAALQSAQLPQATAAGGGDDDGWYSGWYYGVLSNIRRGPWYRDAGNVGRARARTEERVAHWHAGGGRRH